MANKIKRKYHRKSMIDPPKDKMIREPEKRKERW